MERQSELVIGTVKLSVPIFFPSISSIKTGLTVLDYIQVLNALRPLNGQFLISAFDLSKSGNDVRDQIRKELSQSYEEGTVLLMDSGNYESFWKDSKSTWIENDFHEAVNRFPANLAFSFDEQQPPSDHAQHLRLIMERYQKDQDAAGSISIIPIIHDTADNLPMICSEFARLSNVPMLAVPERRLGNGLFERASTLKLIRKALDGSGRYVGLHLLGTGNPISIAIYSIAGADSFDGLEWCQTVVDHDTALLYHFSQADFFRDQTSWGNNDLPFQLRVLSHNLEFYSRWMANLRRSISIREGIDFCRYNFPERLFVQCSSALNWGEYA